LSQVHCGEVSGRTAQVASPFGIVPAVTGTTSVALDDIIFRLQEFGGASDFWRNLTALIDVDPLIETHHTVGSKFSRVLPIRTSCEVLHSSHFRVPFGRDVACVTTIHDLTYELGMNDGIGRHLNLWQRRQAVRRASAIVCISEHTKLALLDFYGDEIRPDALVTTIHHGRTYGEPTRQPLPEPFEEGARFLLHVGNRAGYKNFPVALRAYAGSSLQAENVQFWCTGPPLTADELSLISSLDIGSSMIRHLGVVSTQDLGVLYEHAVGLAYPSLYEGFGLPPLDAMSLGCPVVASAASSVPEIVGDAAILIDPSDVDGFSAAFDSLLDPQTSERLSTASLVRAARYSWERAAMEHSEIYRTVATQ
jgi:glycosyltransferase involved in cell wall biosynthesis